MKTLIEYIAESKVLHQNANIAESKVLHQNANIAESKVLHQNANIAEKLIINKNTKLVSANEIFYEEFKDVLDKNSDFGWFTALNIKDMLPIAMPKDWSAEAKKFFGDNKLYVRYTGSIERDNTTYENMMKFVTGGGFRTDNESMDFTYKNITSKLNRDYKIYLFETDNLKIGLWGWMQADKSHKGTMAFQYK